MGLNISKGNMYPFITHTSNTVKGKCPHGCSYCYMKRFGEQKPIRFDESELKTDLGEGNFIFVGSSCDMWANSIPHEWIGRILEHCQKYDNKYLFQSKNPYRFDSFYIQLPPNSVLGTTIETNRIYPQMGATSAPIHRAENMHLLSASFETMVTIEPIMDFDVDILVSYILLCNPSWVNIGADSQNSNLPEPSPDKIKALIDNLKSEGIEVKIKDNLRRLMGEK